MGPISYNFLHNHPMIEKEKGLDSDHVIVGRLDWLKAREILSKDYNLGTGIPIPKKDEEPKYLFLVESIIKNHYCHELCWAKHEKEAREIIASTNNMKPGSLVAKIAKHK